MSKLMMAVCDTDHGYRDRFVTYLVERKSREVTVHAFSVLESFLEALKEQQFDVVVFGKGFAEAEEAVKEEGIPLLLLQDTVPQQVGEALEYCADQRETCGRAFRYQPMEGILHEIQVLAGGRRVEAAEAVALTSGMEIIGVYSPMHHEMQLPFVMVLSELLSEKQKVLYVNLTKYSGFLELFHLPGEYDLGDIVLRLRNKRLHPETFLRSVYEMDRVCYIPPFSNPENLHDFSMEDYLALLGFLQDRTDFEAVILDFGDGVDRLAERLSYCTSIYCPMKTGYFFECQLNQFLEYLDKETESEVRERMHRVNLPFSAKHIRGGDVRRQLLWSEFGDYVREHLMGVEYESIG